MKIIPHRSFKIFVKKEVKPYLLAYKDWRDDPYQYLLVYATDLNQAKIKSRLRFNYSSGYEPDVKNIKQLNLF